MTYFGGDCLYNICICIYSEQDIQNQTVMSRRRHRYKTYLDIATNDELPRSSAHRLRNAARPISDMGEIEEHENQTNSYSPIPTIGQDEPTCTIGDSCQPTKQDHNEENQIEYLSKKAEEDDVTLAQSRNSTLDDSNDSLSNSISHDNGEDSNSDVSDGQDNFHFLREALLDHPHFLELIQVPVDKRKGDVLIMVMQYIRRHNLSQSAMADLFQLVNNIFVSPVLPTTKYLIDKLFNPRGKVHYHAICVSCEAYLGTFDRSKPSDMTCSSCMTINRSEQLKKTNYFVTFDISETVAGLLEQYDEAYDTIIRTPRMRNEVQDMYDGKVYRQFVKSLNPDERYSYATLTFNTDGAPVFDSSKCAIWPIQIIVNELPPQARLDNRVLYGLWFGKAKPNMNIFFSPFVQDMNRFSEKGIRCHILDEDRLVKLYPICCCVDSVARAPIQGILQFNGNYACGWCMHPGERIDSTVKYTLQHPEPKRRSHKKTLIHMEQAVATGERVYGFKNVSALINLLWFNIILGFVPDYLHCVLLGVARQFAEYWFTKKNEPYSLTNAQINWISRQLMRLKPAQHAARLPRPISERKYWKAKEWENWILFYSTPLLQGNLMMKYIDHWKLFVDSLHILLQQKIHKEQLTRAELLLHEFVTKTQLLYGKPAMTYNVHQLLHLTDCVKNWGPLWACSGFPFETGNGQLKKMIKTAKGILFEVCRHIAFERAASIIGRAVLPGSNATVRNFCSNLTSRNYTQKMLKSSKVTRYFGPPSVPSQFWINKLDLNLQTSNSFKKMVKDGCMYNTMNKINQRSNNSFAQLSDGTFVCIREFIVDEVHNQAFAIVNKLILNSSDNDTGNCGEYLRKYVSISESLEAVTVTNIAKVCVNVRVSSRNYICAFPNLYNY